MSVTITGSAINNLTVPSASGSLVGSGANYPLNIDANAAANSIQIDSSGRLINTTVPYAGGTISSGTGSGDRGITTDFNRGFSISSPNITVPRDGIYFVSYKQLVSTSGSQYFGVYKNGSLVKYAYSLGSQYNDLGLALIIECSVNDYIYFNHQNGMTNTWSGGHSNWSIWLIAGS